MSSTKKPFRLNITNFKTFFYFAVVGGFGVIVNTLILYVLSQYAGMNYIMASIIATETAIISNFIGNNYITFRDNKNNFSLARKFLSFQVISMISLVGTVFFLWLFVSTFGQDLLLVWNVLAILIMFVANFVLNSAYTWKIKPIVQAKDPAPAHYIFESGPHHHGRKSTKDKGGSSLLGIFMVLVVICLVSFALPIASAEKKDKDDDNGKGLGHIKDEIESVVDEVTETPSPEPAEQDTEQNNEEVTSSPTEELIDVPETPEVIVPIIESSDDSEEESDASHIVESEDSSPTVESAASANQEESNDNVESKTVKKGANSDPVNEEEEGVNGISVLNNLLDEEGSIVAVSQLGYHPSSVKEVVVYTDAASGSFAIKTTGGATVATLPLARATNYNGNNVNCQGNMPCLIGDFSSFVTPGTYYIEAVGSQSDQFTIGTNIFSSTVPIFFEFFNAQLQQGSAYHADMHSSMSPPFTTMSDGSFIMESDQASLSLIRLGSAYRRNPQLFQFDNYNMLATGKPDIQEYIVNYVDYLENMQGISVQEGNGPGAVRLGSGMVVNHIFVPGPTNLTTMNVYIPTNPPTLLQSAQVKSLCGADDGSASWDSCIAYAAAVYKCQVDEPCLNMSYNDRKGVVTSNPAANGYGVSKGWGYEFGCYFDVDLDNGNFNNAVNPCQIFYENDNRYYTTTTLLAFLEAYPAVNDYSSARGQELLARSVATLNYIDSNYPDFTSGSSDAGFYGAALFLLYDYTGQSSYLDAAYNARSTVSTTFISDMTRGNEFYWEEYARHKAAIIASGKTYAYNGENPEELFRNKIYHDYKDAGPNSMGNNGERVFQFDNNIQFQNSRYILTEGLLGTKTLELAPNPESFIRTVAHNQLSWLTGMNLVQQEVSFNSPVDSMSFIFGIGDHPEEYHSRWLVDTGMSDASSGKVVGARGTGYQFFDSSSGEYVYLDGTSYIMGSELGAMGNEWRGEAPTPQIVQQEFNNGKDYIPGWINGPFPSSADQDTIFNYHDTASTYEYTETTNEIVATAIEYYAYLDGGLNNRPRHVLGGVSLPTVNTTTNTTVPVTNSTTNTTNSTVPPSNSTQNSTGNATASSGARIVSNSTSLGNSRYMREDANATFYINSNASNSITWYVDGIEQETTVGQSVSFTWSPGVFFLPKAPDYVNIESSVISAVSPTQTVTWTVQVEDVINPYFSSVDDGGDVLGSADAKIHVLVNKRFYSFSGLNVTLSNGGSQTTYELSSFPSNSNETDWTVYIPSMPGGNTYITQVVGYTNSSGAVVTYDLGPSRAHYRTVAGGSSGGSDDDDDDYWKRSRGGSGGGSSASGSAMELVYVLFEKDVVDPGDEQTITLDAKNFNGGISGVEAKLVSESGKVKIVKLELVSGDKSYGTWSATFGDLDEPGEYIVKSVTLKSGVASKEIAVQDRKFYYLDEEGMLAANAPLSVVYAVLSDSQVNKGAEVKITVDAREATGVLSVTAQVVSNRGDSFDVPLKLTKGNSQYGTWTGSFIANNTDTTYTMKSLTLTSKNETITQALSDRSVYVRAGPLNRANLNGITGEVVLSPFTRDYWVKSLQNPMGPTILGFALMFVVIGAILVVNKNAPTA